MSDADTIRKAASRRSKRRTAAWLLVAAFASSGAQAAGSGSFQVRYYTVPAPLTPADGLSVAAQYQSQVGQPVTSSLDLKAERRQLNLSARLSLPHQSVQVSARRRSDTEAGRQDASATATYTYIPTVAATGPAFTSLTALYVYSDNETPTYSVQTHTGGFNVSGRLSTDFNSSLTATTTAVLLGNDAIWSGNGSGTLVYAHDTTSAYLSPSVTAQSGAASWSVSGGGSTRFSDALSANLSANWTPGQVPSGTLSGLYTTGPWQLSSNLGYTAQAVSLGAGARISLPADLTLGTAVAWVPSSRTAVYSADASKRLGDINVGLVTSYTAAPETPATFSIGASVAARQKPWTGSISTSYNRTGQRISGNASGTLSFESEVFGAQMSLGLLLSTPYAAASAPAASPVLSGTADLTLTYALNQQFDLSGSLRYERSVALSAQPYYRLGAGLRYRFGDKEK